MSTSIDSDQLNCSITSDDVIDDDEQQLQYANNGLASKFCLISNDKQIVYYNKAKLDQKSCGPVFEKEILSGDTIEARPINASFDDVQELLLCLLEDKPIDENNIHEIMPLAYQYKIPILLERCQQFFDQLNQTDIHRFSSDNFRLIRLCFKYSWKSGGKGASANPFLELITPKTIEDLLPYVYNSEDSNVIYRSLDALISRAKEYDKYQLARLMILCIAAQWNVGIDCLLPHLTVDILKTILPVAYKARAHVVLSASAPLLESLRREEAVDYWEFCYKNLEKWEAGLAFLLPEIARLVPEMLPNIDQWPTEIREKYNDAKLVGISQFGKLPINDNEQLQPVENYGHLTIINGHFCCPLPLLVGERLQRFRCSICGQIIDARFHPRCRSFAEDDVVCKSCGNVSLTSIYDWCACLKLNF